ncbi:hypothetical protein TNCV_3116881 [Trichonephila clavipes]|nr:hypothetical protein TNCV_3116881 [Trichonephila clavipes]
MVIGQFRGQQSKNKINSLVPSQFWRHVPGEIKPRRFAFERHFPSFIFLTIWEGSFLAPRTPSNWPHRPLGLRNIRGRARKKESYRLCNLVAVEGKYLGMPLSLQFSVNYSFCLVDVAFCGKRKEKTGVSKKIGDLTIHEIEHAEKTLIKIVKLSFFLLRTRFLI